MMISEALLYKFKNTTLINDALRHSSIKKHATMFERLEFLGDRVLGLVISEYLFINFKNHKEGSLAKMHSAFVCSEACYKVAQKICLDKKIQTAGDQLKKNKTVLADAMEAIIGAVFIDGGFDAARTTVLHLWQELFEGFDTSFQDPKTQLQELTQAKTGEVPVYEVVSVSGPDHDQTFVVSAKAKMEEELGEGKSIKLAEIDAAKKLLAKLLVQIKSF